MNKKESLPGREEEDGVQLIWKSVGQPLDVSASRVGMSDRRTVVGRCVVVRRVVQVEARHAGAEASHLKLGGLSHPGVAVTHWVPKKAEVKISKDNIKLESSVMSNFFGIKENEPFKVQYI